jgi:hypothetical protein
VINSMSTPTDPIAQLRHLAQVALAQGHHEEAAKQFSQALAVGLQTDARSVLDTLATTVEAAREMERQGAYSAIDLLAQGMTQAIAAASQAMPFEDQMGHAAGLARQVATILGAIGAIQSGTLPIGQTEAWVEKVRQQARQLDDATGGWLQMTAWIDQVLGRDA